MAMKIPKQHLCCCPSLYQSYFAAYSSGTIYHPFMQLLGFPPNLFFFPPTSPYVLLKILDSLHDCCLGTPSPHSLSMFPRWRQEWTKRKPLHQLVIGRSAKSISQKYSVAMKLEIRYINQGASNPNFLTISLSRRMWLRVTCVNAINVNVRWNEL